MINIIDTSTMTKNQRARHSELQDIGADLATWAANAEDVGVAPPPEEILVFLFTRGVTLQEFWDMDTYPGAFFGHEAFSHLLRQARNGVEGGPSRVFAEFKP